MKIKRIIEDKEYIFELSMQELVEANNEYEYICYNEDLDNLLEYEDYSISKKSFIEYKRDEIIDKYKDNRDDYNMEWYDALECSISDTLSPLFNSIFFEPNNLDIYDWNIILNN